MLDSFDFSCEIKDEITVVNILLSRATLAKAVTFKEYIGELIAKGSNKLVIDLSKCEYVDSTFLGAMVALLKKVNSINGDLRLVYNKEMPSLVFVLTRMDKVFKVFPNLDEAMESFGGGKPKLQWK
jgi:anti-anti-sigma factor